MVAFQVIFRAKEQNRVPIVLALPVEINIMKLEKDKSIPRNILNSTARQRTNCPNYTRSDQHHANGK